MTEAAENYDAGDGKPNLDIAALIGRPEVRKLAAQTMVGDFMSAILDEVKSTQHVWQQLSEKQQDQMLSRIQRRAETLVNDEVHIIASDGRITIPAIVESVAYKDQIKTVITTARTDPSRHTLADQTGKEVLILIIDKDAYQGGKDAIKSDPDQPPLFGATAADPGT